MNTNELEVRQPAEAWPVYRKRPLPVGEVRGTFLISEPLIIATREALTSFALAGIHDGGHEGLTYWAGVETERCTLLLQSIVPDADHSEGGVFVSREEVGRMSRTVRGDHLGILCQVHSHPGGDARHSDGDDGLILMPFEGMLSIVVPNFGIRFSGIEDTCVHQYQDGRWVLCTPESVIRSVKTIPSCKDLR